MYNKLPQSTKQYLSLLMEDKIHENRGDNTIDFKKSYLSKFNNLQEQDCSKYLKQLYNNQNTTGIPPECVKAFQEKMQKEKIGKEQKGGGSGSGVVDKETYKVSNNWGDFPKMKDSAPSPSEILFGDTDATGMLLTPASYIIGGLGELMAKGKWAPMIANKIASNFPGPIGQAIGGKMGRVVGKAGEAFSDILAQKYADVNADDLAYQLGANLLGGAGKPFVKLQMPVRQDDRYDWWRRQSLLQQSN